MPCKNNYFRKKNTLLIIKIISFELLKNDTTINNPPTLL